MSDMHIWAQEDEARRDDNAAHQHSMRADMANARADRWKDRHDKERAARLALVAKIEALAESGMTDAGDCCRDYCVADVHDLRLDQAERLEEVLRALLTADDTKATS